MTTKFIKQNIIIIGFAVAVIAAILFYWLQKSTWVPLLENFEEQQASSVTTKLNELNIPFKLTNDGQLLVNESDFSNAKIQISEQQKLYGESVGLEVFDNLDYGMTEFSQKIHYQRALQGELSRSIMGIDGIDYARVHLSLPEKRLFKNDQRKASAAIAISGKNIDQNKLNSIKELVAASIDGLDASDVVITDSDGRVYNAKDSISSSLQTKLEQKQAHEREIKTKIESLLSMIYDKSDYAVSVNVTLNFNKIQQTSNDYIKHDDKIILKRTSKPGAAKNKNESIEYGYGTKVESIEYSIGEVDKITTGIIITKSLSPQEMKQLEELLISAVGINSARGDELKVAAIPLQQNSIEKAVEPAINPRTNPTSEKVVNKEVISESTIQKDKQKTTPEETSESTNENSSNFLDMIVKHSSLIIILLLALSLLTTLIVKQRSSLSLKQREKLLVEVKSWLKE